MRLRSSRLALLVLSVGCVLVASMVAVAQESGAPALKKTAPPYMSPTSGKEMYIAYCGACHGAQGKGDGPAAAALKVAPTDLTQLIKRNNGKFPDTHFRDVIEHGTVAAHGSADMPVWGHIFRVMDSDPAFATLRVENLMNYVGALNYPIK
jgi:mono/diheme cytochrome c family protein